MTPRSVPGVCPKCRKPQSWCVCEFIKPLSTRTRVLILQYPREPHEHLGTAHLAHLMLADSRLAVGLSWPNLAAACGQAANPREWGVLYLGTAKTYGSEIYRSQVISLIDRRGVPQPDGPQQLKGLAGIVALDGNWRQAKTLWWRNPWLLRLKRLVLNPPSRSLYGRLRREPRRESVSTLEALAVAIAELESRPEVKDLMFDLLKKFLLKTKQTGREFDHQF